MDAWFVYILLCKNGRLYTGIARDVVERFVLHQAGKGAKFTQRNLPEKIVYMEKCKSMSVARLRENEIKKMTKGQKEMLLK